MKQLFVPHQFRAKGHKLLVQANEILDEYQELGHRLTLRQLYYQFVARDLLPNTPASYTLVGGMLNRGRDAGEIDWDMIEDRTRELIHVQFDHSPASAIEFALRTYAEDPWLTQEYFPIVAIEKDALLGVITDVCDRYRVKRLSLRGNCSNTLVYELAKLCVEQEDEGRTPMVLLLTDHDPAGVISMPQDLTARLERYAERPILVRRLALTMAQVEEYDLPDNFAKESDSRYRRYQVLYGDKSWELDALAPDVLSALVGDALASLVDDALWDAARAREQANKAKLASAAKRMKLR
jgi:hypothetical protein